jgi:hypothetical protein
MGQRISKNKSCRVIPIPLSILSILRFPLLQVCLSTQRSLRISFKPSFNRLHLPCHKRSKLHSNQITYQSCLVIQLAPYLGIFQVLRHNICPDFVPVYLVPSVLGMRPHRSGARTLVESLIRLFCIQCVPRNALAEDFGGLHDVVVAEFHCSLELFGTTSKARSRNMLAAKAAALPMPQEKVLIFENTERL